MPIDDTNKKREKNQADSLTLVDFMPKRAEPKPIQPPADEESDDAGSTVNLQKRNYELDATRYGDWELNGRCVDF